MSDRPIVLLLDSRQAGGIETHIFQLSRALCNNNWPVQIWFYQRHQDEHPLEKQLQEAKLLAAPDWHSSRRKIVIHYLGGKAHHLMAKIRKIRPLLLHTHGYKAGIFGRLAAMLNKTPVVSTFHNGDPGEGIVRLYTLLDQLTSVVSKNIAVSDEIARRHIHSPKTINNFVEVPAHPRSAGQAIAFVGRLSYEKGPDLFLQLARHQPLLPFRLYGSGPMAEHLQKQPTDNVQFMGQVPSMETHWREIGLLCITSRFEGLPMVALEAMAHGVPVLSFPLGGLPELITQGLNGWISPAGDLRAMSNLLQFWFSLPEAVKWQLHEASVATINNRYSSQAILPQILAVYQEAVQAKGYSWPEIINNKALPDC